MKSLYQIIKHANSHGLVSLPFLGLIQYYLEKNDFSLIKNAPTEIDSNLSYITLSGAREFNFNAVSDLTARLSILLKQATLQNVRETENSHARNAYNINKGRLFVPKIEDPLDTVIEILDDTNVEHKKMCPYVPPQVQTADEVETETALVDEEFTDLRTKYDEINDVATEQKKQHKITNLVDDIIDKSNPFQNLGTEDIWIEDDLFDKNDNKETIEISKDILKDVNKNDPFLDFSVPTEQIISDIFDDADLTDDEVTIENVTDDETVSEKVIIASDDDLNTDEDTEEISAVPAVVQWYPKKTTVSANARPRTYLPTNYGSASRAENKIKNKYKKKILGKKEFEKDPVNNKRKKSSTDWLKTAGYLDTKDQDAIN